MSEVADLWVMLRANTTGFTAGMARAGAVAEESSATIRRSLVTAGVLGAGAIVGIGVAALKMGTEFQTNMTLIRTQAHDTTDNLHWLGQQVLTVGQQFGVSGIKGSEAMYHIASAGYTGRDAVNVYKNALELAAVGHSDLETTANALVGVLQSGIVGGAKNAGYAVSVMNAIIGAGNMRMQDFVQSLSSGIMPAAKTFGMSMQSVGAAMALMTDQGSSAVESATKLRMSISLIGAPSKAAVKDLTAVGFSSADAGRRVSAMQKVLQESGVQTTQLANDLRKPDGFLVALSDLKTHMQAAGISATEQSALISRAFGGGRSGAAIMGMYSKLDLLKQKFGQIASGTKLFGSDLSISMNTLGFQVDKTKARMENWLIELGQKLMPAASAALKGLNKMFDWLGQHKDVTMAIAGGIAGMLVPALWAAATAAGALAAGVIAATWPFIAIGAAVVLLYEKFKPFRTLVNEIGKVLRTVLGGAMSWVAHSAAPMLRNAWKACWDAMAAVLHWFAGPISWIKGEFSGLTNFFHEHGKQVAQIFQLLWTTVYTIYSTYLKVLITLVTGAFKAIWAVISSVFKDVIHIVRDSWKTIAAVFKFALDAIMGTVGIFIDLLTGHWGQAWHDLIHLAKTAWNDLKSAAKSFFGGLVGDFVGFGKDLVNGLIKGIKSMAGAAKSAIGSIGHGIKSGFKAALSIFSPSKDFVGYGQNIVQGLINGINSLAPSAVKASQDLAYNASQAALKFTRTKGVTHHRGHINGILAGQHHLISGLEDNLAKDITGFIHQRVAISKFATGHKSAAGIADSLRMLTILQGTEGNVLGAARKQQAAIGKDPYATRAEKTRAARQVDQIVKQLQLDAQMRTKLLNEQITAHKKAAAHHARREGARKAIAGELPTYLEVAAAAGYTTTPGSGRGAAGTAAQPIVVQVQSEIFLDKKKVGRAMQTHHLRHERRNPNNGLSRRRSSKV